MFGYEWNASTFTASGMGDWSHFQEVIHEKQYQVTAYFKNDFRLHRRYIESEVDNTHIHSLSSQNACQPLNQKVTACERSLFKLQHRIHVSW